MTRIRNSYIRASDIAEYLNKELKGEDFIINDPSCILSESLLTKDSKLGSSEDKNLLIIGKSKEPYISCKAYIESENPDLDYSYIIREFFLGLEIDTVHPTAIISEEAKIGKNNLIGAYSIINSGVIIGNNNHILSHVVINSGVQVGNFCVIKNGAIVGCEAWTFLSNEFGAPVHQSNLGSTIIKNNVWIGSNSTIERGLKDTIIEDNVQIDDLVHIGSGVLIGEGTRITAGTIISVNVSIGKHVHIGPNCVIRENIKIGDRTLIGMGSVVVSDLLPDRTYMGSPARLKK